MISRKMTSIVDAVLTRPADTTQYAPYDMVADSTSAPSIIEFEDAARQRGAGGMIKRALCIDSANQSTKPQLRLFLFDEEVTVDNDNSKWLPTDAEMAHVLGAVDFSGAWLVCNSTGSGADGNLLHEVDDISIGFKCRGDARSIYGVPVMMNAYTPISGEQFTFRLIVEQD